MTNWPKITPTYHRLGQDEIQTADDRIQRFSTWINATPGLEELAEDPDKLIAVAQHYGMATTFLDFTTEPTIAGFFATDGGPPQPGLESCIICLDLEEAQRIWRLVKPRPSPELIELDVSNLWRLEAQHGSFVWCPYDTLDGPYPLDRIVFPYTGAAGIPRREVYPARASPLERLLDQYFQEEQIRAGSRFLDETLRGTSFSTLTNTGEPFIAASFVAPPRPHSSWTDASVAPFLTLDREYWPDVHAAPQLDLHLDALAAPRHVRARVHAQVAAALAQTPRLRHVAPHWHVGAHGGSDGLADALTRALQRVWDGMARLPYSDEHIAVALGTTAALACARAATDGDRRAAARCLLDRAVDLELGGGGENVHAFEWAAEPSLHAAVRDDFSVLLRDECRDRVLASTFNTLMTARDPRLLFDFARLTELFAFELIPSQAALDAGNAAYFSPARLDVLGPA